MKKNIQKITLLSILFVFSTIVTFAGEDQCTVVPTPTPPGFTATIETVPEAMPGTLSETAPENDKTGQLPDFIQLAIDTLSILF